MDVITMSSVVQQGLILRDRIFTVSVLLPDKPGELSKVAGVVAKENGNVIKLDVFAEDDDGEVIEIEVKADCVSEELRDGRTFRMDMRRQEANPAAGVC